MILRRILSVHHLPGGLQILKPFKVLPVNCNFKIYQGIVASLLFPLTQSNEVEHTYTTGSAYLTTNLSAPKLRTASPLVQSGLIK